MGTKLAINDETKIEKVTANRALILVMGGDMRDLSEQAKDHLDIVRGMFVKDLVPRYSTMRPADRMAIDLVKDLEILVLADRFQHKGVTVERIPGESVAKPQLYGGENPAALLPAALKACRGVERVAVVFWGHSSGRFGGLLGDAHPDPKKRGEAWLTIHEAAEYFKKGEYGIKRKVDLIGVIGCFSGMIDVLHEFAPYTRTFAGFANKIDVRFFDWQTFLDPPLETGNKDERWAAAFIRAAREGFEKYEKQSVSGYPSKEYRFAECKASAWRTEGLLEVFKELGSVVKEIPKSWPGVVERAARNVDYYDDMDSANLRQFVNLVKDQSKEEGFKDLTSACEKFLQALEETEITSGKADSNGFASGLGVWLPRAAGPAFEKVRASLQLSDPARQEIHQAWIVLQEARLGVERPETKLRALHEGMTRHIATTIRTYGSVEKAAKHLRVAQTRLRSLMKGL